LHSTLPIGATWEYDVADLTVLINFDELMDTSVAPSLAELVLTVDSTVKAIDTITWLDSTTLQVEYNEAALGPVLVEIAMPIVSADFRDEHLFLVGLFDLTAIAV